MSWPEPPEVPPLPGSWSDQDRAMRRIGWAILAMNAGKFHTAELHLAEATAALQQIQRKEESTAPST